MSIQAAFIKGISELVLHHDYVIIPQFGGFVARTQGAHFSTNGQLLFPPGRKLSFNAQLKQNDGMLEHWIQDDQNCSYEQAVREVAQFADYCHSILQVKKRLTFGDIGFFYLNFENTLCFEPQEQSNFSLETFGLLPVSASLLPVTTPPLKENLFKDRVLSTEPAKTQLATTASISQQRRYRNYAIAAVGGIVLFGALSFLLLASPIQQVFTAGLWGSNASNYRTFPYADIQPIPVTNENSIFVTNAEGFSSLAINDKTWVVNMTDKVEVPVNTVKSVATTNYENSSFKIVVGCFSVADNATRLVKKLRAQQFKAFISGVNNRGMQIVSCGGYNSKEAALAELPLIQNTCPEAWIKPPEH